MLNFRYMVALFAGLLLMPISPAQAQQTTLEQLTLEQRVAQMFMVSLFGSEPTAVGAAFLQRWQPGGVILFGYNAGTPEAVTALTNSFQQTVTDSGGLPLLIAIDQEGGVVARLTEGFTAFPAPAVLTATADATLAYNFGGALAEELRAVGVYMNLAPVADLETNPANTVIRRRAFGSDPALTAPILSGVVQGLQAGGVLATVKHFPGHGDSFADSHLELPIIDLDRARLDAVELAPFRAAIAAGTEAVMVAHIWYPALEPEPNLPATLSRNIITGLLREEMGYDGLVITDALDMDAIDAVYTQAEAAVLAIQAGVDLIALGPHVGLDAQEAALQAVVDAVRSGQIPQAQIDASVARILDAKARYGVLAWQPLATESASARVQAEPHAQLIDAVFAAGVTVAYDRGNLLPLDENRRVALIYPGSRAQIRNECSAYRDDVRWVGVSDFPTTEEIAWAQDAARWAEALVVFTHDAVDNPAQQTLVRALPAEKTAVVALRSAYDWTAFPDVAAYMLTYSPARPAVPAACAALFGAIPIQGQLPLALGAGLPAVVGGGG